MGEQRPQNGEEDEPWENMRPLRASPEFPGLCKKAGVAVMQGTPPPPPRKVDVDEGDGQDRPVSYWPAWLWSGVEILFLFYFIFILFILERESRGEGQKERARESFFFN